MHNLLPGVPDEKSSTDPKFCTNPSNFPKQEARGLSLHPTGTTPQHEENKEQYTQAGQGT